MENLFVYGSLLQGRVQKRVIGREITSIEDRVKGYMKSTLRLGGKKYPVAVPFPGKLLEGKMLEVTWPELISLDEYERDAYRRIKVVLQSGKEAWMDVGK